AEVLQILYPVAAALGIDQLLQSGRGRRIARKAERICQGDLTHIQAIGVLQVTADVEIVIGTVIHRMRGRPAQQVKGRRIIEDRLHRRARLLQLSGGVAAGGVTHILPSWTDRDDLSALIVYYGQTDVEILVRERRDLTVAYFV